RVALVAGEPVEFCGSACRRRGRGRGGAARWLQQRPRGNEPPIKTRSPHRPDLLAWATSESPGPECSRVRLTIQQRELASGVRGGDVFKHPPLSFLRLISDQELGVLDLQAVLERQGAADGAASVDRSQRFLRA